MTYPGSRSVTLVSKRFRRLFYELAPPSIIGSEFELSQFLASKHALLQRVAPLVAEFVVRKPYPEQLTWQLDGSGGHRPLAAFLQQLPPSLTALDLQLQSTLPLQAGQAMQQLAALRSLSLNDVQAADMLPAVLQRMPQLEQLQCSMRSCPDGLASSVCQLSGLTSLFLLVLQGSVPSVQRLTRLSQLRGLTLHQRARLRPPPPSAFPCLQSYEFSADLDGGVEVRWRAAKQPRSKQQHGRSAQRRRGCNRHLLCQLIGHLHAVLPPHTPLLLTLLSACCPPFGCSSLAACCAGAASCGMPRSLGASTPLP